MSAQRTPEQWRAYVDRQMDVIRAEDEQRIEVDLADQAELVRATAHEFGVSDEEAEVILAREEDTGIPAEDAIEPIDVYTRASDQDAQIAAIEAEIDDILTQADLTQEAEDSQ